MSKIAFLTLPLPSGKEQRGSQISEIAENYGLFPSLGLLRLASLAFKEGFEVEFLDANAERLSSEEIIARLQAAQVQFICLTLQTQVFPHTVSLLKEIKANMECKILGGGPHVELYPKETMESPEIDFALSGPADVEFPLFLRSLKGQIPLEKVPGLIFRQGGVIICNPPSSMKSIPGDMPWPARSLLNQGLYHSIITRYKPYTIIVSAPGCPYKCNFCEQGRTALAAIPAKQVVAEMVSLAQAQGIKEVEFFDPIFTLKRDRVMEICHGLIQNGVKLKWSARTRVDLLDKELLDLMAAAGCIRLYMGIESGSDKILASHHKDLTVADSIHGVQMVKQAGIEVFGFFIIGAPEDTEETIRETIQLAKGLNLDYAQFSKLIASPKTPLYEESFGSEDKWGTLKSPFESAPTVNGLFSAQELEKWVRKAYLTFYFRPSYIWKGLRRVRTVGELGRAANVAVLLLWTFARSFFSKNFLTRQKSSDRVREGRAEGTLWE